MVYGLQALGYPQDGKLVLCSAFYGLLRDGLLFTVMALYGLTTLIFVFSGLCSGSCFYSSHLHAQGKSSIIMIP